MSNFIDNSIKNCKAILLDPARISEHEEAKRMIEALELQKELSEVRDEAHRKLKKINSKLLGESIGVLAFDVVGLVLFFRTKYTILGLEVTIAGIALTAIYAAFAYIRFSSVYSPYVKAEKAAEEAAKRALE